MSIWQELEPCDSHKMCLASVGAFGWVVFTPLSGGKRRELSKLLLDWEALVFYFTLNLLFLCHRVTADYCQQIASLYCYGSIISSGLERNQRKNAHQRWATRAQSFCISVIKHVSGIKLIREKEALAWVSLARVKRHIKHLHRYGYKGERVQTRGKKPECGRESRVARLNSI